SAPPVFAGRARGAATFLHESNSIPGRANRLVARFVDEAYVFFHGAAKRMRCARVRTTGMPVRSQFQPMDAAGCRLTLGLNAHKPVVLIMGGSQGASGINELVMQALPKLETMAPDLQFIHLTGTRDYAHVKAAYQHTKLKAVVEPFMTEMELALGAASAAISRAGASSLAEIAAMRLPSILIPFPAAADNHQLFNARAFADCGAARMVEQSQATAEALNWLILELANNPVSRGAMANALEGWHFPNAAADIVNHMLGVIGVGASACVETKATAKPVSVAN
ncbi:MAG: glycosyltransferase, partial [Verrucomicrobiota bacterium]